jgi:hypothetical protein
MIGKVTDDGIEGVRSTLILEPVLGAAGDEGSARNSVSRSRCPALKM